MTVMDKGTDRPRAILSNHRVRAVFKSKAPSVRLEDTFQLCPKLGKAFRCGSLLQNSSLIRMEKTAGYMGDPVSNRLQIHAQGHITYGEDGVEAMSGATVTSTAVKNAINAGLDFYETVLKGGN